MNTKQAKQIIGNQPKYAVRNMRRALEMFTYLNTNEDWSRLQACYVVMRIPYSRRIPCELYP